jgi:DNA sulfur modification protein DndC
MVINVLSSLLEQKKIIFSAKEQIQKMYIKDSVPWVIGYSGGKDSTATTQIVIETLLELKEKGIELNKKVYVISSDTLVETPIIIKNRINTINGINELAKVQDLPLSAQLVKPDFDQTFWTNVIGRGYPTPNQTFRWCTDRMKIDPANKFVKTIIEEYGEAVMLLGVRDGESLSRDRSIQNHSILGSNLMRHSTMSNAYVFAPIKNFTLDVLWSYLLESKTPWGTDNNELYKLYSDSSAECPLIIDQDVKNETGSCGNSRFGCWVCTVVKEDKSLSGFIKTGEDWLRPLLEYRNWLYSIRDNDEFRMKRRTNGMLYFSSIKENQDKTLTIPQKGAKQKNTIIKNESGQWFDISGNEWKIFDDEALNNEDLAKRFITENNIDLSSGNNPRIIIKNYNNEYQQLGNGPFTFETRVTILKKLLETQKEIQYNENLIQVEELLEIRKIWINEGDWEDHVSKIYFEVFGNELFIPKNDFGIFQDQDMEALKKLCSEEDFEFKTYNELIQNTRVNLGLVNRKDSIKKIESILSKEFLSMFSGLDNEN